MCNAYAGFRLLESSLRIVTVTEKVMDPSFSMSLCQGTTSPLGIRKKSKETGAVEKTSESMIGGRSVSPIIEGNILANASTRQDSEMTGVAKRALLCRNPTVAASAEPVYERHSDQLRLPHGLKTIREPKNSTEIPKGEIEGKQFILNLIHEAYNLTANNRRSEAYCNIFFASRLVSSKYPEDPSMMSRVYQCLAYISSFKNERAAFRYFNDAEELARGPTNFPEALFAKNLKESPPETSKIMRFGFKQ